jgi:hypothetical protein
VGRRAIADYERGARLPFDRTLEQIQKALEGMGIEFVFQEKTGVGVMKKNAST